MVRPLSRGISALLLLLLPVAASAQGRRPTRAAQPLAVRNPPPRTWTAVSAGSGFTCALDNTGQAFCWGENLNKKLGISDSAQIRRPTPIETPMHFQSLATGTFDACALTRDGGVACWGGEQNPTLPHATFGTARFKQLDMENGGCGVALDGAAWCWGPNTDFQLGSGRTTAVPSSGPERVSSGARWTQVVVGNTHACGLSADGRAYCWGGGNKLGSGSARANSAAPVAVTGSRRFLQLAAGAEHTCGIAQDSTAWCWGAGAGGALGNGMFQPAYAPVPVSGGLKFKALSAGYSYTCGITVQSRVFCWGGGDHGTLGTGQARSAASPIPVAGAQTYTAIASGPSHSCAIATDGTLFCWGDNADGELGIARSQTCRTAVAGGRADVRPCAMLPTRVQDPR